MNQIKIGNHLIGVENSAFIIAEISQAHEGSLGMAHSFIDATARAGADAVKFQTHIAASESTRDESFRIPMSGQDETRYDYWKRMEFSEDQWLGLQKHAHEKGLVFLSSAFSLDAVSLLQKMGMPAWKVGSGEFKSTELLEAMSKTGKPILYSTGMSTYDEIESAVRWFKHVNSPFGIFQCTSKYPTPIQEVGLNVLEEFKNKYQCPIGLSDHSGTIFPSLSSIAKNADMIEVHVTFDKGMYGPDTIASITFEQLSFIVKMRDAHREMMTNPVNKDTMAAQLDGMRNLFTKSIALKRDMPESTKLAPEMLVAKKPGTGIPYSHKDSIVGRVLNKNVSMERLLKEEDLK